ncbi:unnamed protein product [Rotaria socialis]|uniref:Uncharacterized protein n=8 Tax=Rotaria TaxID=231623 RepID=A0A820TVM5_9BILA|nr:unnamed protein product [Rotaria socialis]CAF4476841.1 unnamed protein product [Rotaria socialis]
MAESFKNPNDGLFNIRSTPSNEHLVFAETLRDWRDPLLQGHSPIPVLICPRCALCKCQSVKYFHNTSSSSIRQHEPSCPNFRHQHERAKTPRRQRVINQTKRRAISHDSSITVIQSSSSSSSSIVQLNSTGHSPLLQSSKRTESPSKIPVRISIPLNNSSSILKIDSSNNKTKIPRLTIAYHPIIPSPNRSVDDLYEIDSLNNDTDQITSADENTSSNTNINMKTSHHLNNPEEQVSLRNKKKKYAHTISISDKRQRRHRHKDGRPSKSKSTSNDLSSSSSLSSSSQSLVQIRKKFHSSTQRQSPTAQVLLSSASPNSLEKNSSKQHSHPRTRSTVASNDQSNLMSSPISSQSSSSIYLIQVTNQTEPKNSFGLTKTVPYVWKNTNKTIHNEEKNFYPQYSVEQIPPTNDYRKHPAPVSSRNITLQRGQLDYWQNLESLPDSIITSSCQNLTGSASNLLLSSPLIQQATNSQDSHGNIISITTTKRSQSSLLNQNNNLEWNIQKNGVKLHYSKIKWYSDNQLYKNRRLRNINKKEYKTDNYTDSGSSGEQKDRSAPLIYDQQNITNLTNQNQEALENFSMNPNSEQIDSIVLEYSTSHPGINNTSLSIMSNDKITDSSSTPSSKPVSIHKPKQISYASTDEDVDELNSRYFEDIDRSLMTAEDYREKLNTRLSSSINEQNENQTNSTFRPRILSTEYSQITIDSGVDIASEQKTYQPNTTLTIDEQLSEPITDQHDAFNLSDDSLIERNQLKLASSLNQSLVEPSEYSISMNKTEQEIYFSAKSDLNNQNSSYCGYELEIVTDEEDDDHHHHHHDKTDNSNKLMMASEEPPTIPASSSPNPQFPIPFVFEFKLPSFGEWIDRAFTSFLSDTSTNPPPSISSSRSSSVGSIHASLGTANTSSSSHIITVLDTHNLQIMSTDANANSQQVEILSRNEEQDDEYSLNDMSSSSLNCEKVDFDTYIINSNYEKINPSITCEQNEILFVNERSKSLLSSITSSIENVDQEVMNDRRMQADDEQNYIEFDHDNNIPQQTITTAAAADRNDAASYLFQDKFQSSSNSHDSLNQSDHHIDTAASSIDDLTKTNQFLTSTFYSKDSALGLSDDNLDRTQSNELIIFEDNEQQDTSLLITSQDKVSDDDIIEVNLNTDFTCETMQKSDEMISINDEIKFNEREKSVERTISTSSSEQLIPKEKQTGMYYKAFGSAATILLTEQYRCEWFKEKLPSKIIEKPVETDNTNHVRIVHQSQIIGDDEDEFYFSPQTLQSCHSSPNLTSKPPRAFIRERSYSLSTLDAYIHLNITHETLEQIWQSLLNVAFSDKDDNDLNEYKLRHIIGLSNSNTNVSHTLIEKSRSHNDIFSISNQSNQKPITKIKSKSFEVTTSSVRQSFSSMNTSGNLGLLQGADISEPFADRLISISIQSDVESIPSLEHEQISHEDSVHSPSSKEPLSYVFNFSNQVYHDEYDLEQVTEMEDKAVSLSVTYEDTEDEEEDMPPIIQIHNLYEQLSLFRPHSLSTIPSSRASQYASSVDSDDIFERERPLYKELNVDNSDDNCQFHASDDDHGVIGSEFSSPQSRPLSSIHSQPLSPEQIQQFKSLNFSSIDNDAWERCIDEPIFYDDLFLGYKNEEQCASLTQDSNNITSIIAIEPAEHQQTYMIDQIEPISSIDANNKENIDSTIFIQKLDTVINQENIEQDYITMEQQPNSYLDLNELVQRLEQLDSTSRISMDERETKSSPDLIDHEENNSQFNIENLISIVNEIRKPRCITKISKKQLVIEEPVSIDLRQALLMTKPAVNLSKRYQTQCIDKVSDLEIVKQGKGFKIGYIDRQGADQRVILTKRIEAAPDTIQRDPQDRSFHGQRRYLNPTFSSVLHTNGSNNLQEDASFQRIAETIQVPTIGTNPKHFDESDMVSIDIDGPSTMLNSICESIVITQGSVYSRNSAKSQSEKSNSLSTSDSPSYTVTNQYEEYLIQTSHHLKDNKIEVIDSWHDHAVISGSSIPWRSPFKPIKYIPPSLSTSTIQTNTPSIHYIERKPIDSNKQQKSTLDADLSPILTHSERQYQTTGTSPITVRQTVDRSCQYSPPLTTDQGLQCCFEAKTTFTQVSSYEIPGFLQTQDRIQTNDNLNYRTMLLQPTTLERSADSGILVDDNHRRTSNLALQVDIKSSSSDSEDISEVTRRPLLRQMAPNNNHILFENTTLMNSNLKATTTEIEQEILQLRRERAHILDLLSLNWSRSNIWVELTEAKLNYIIGETDALLRSLSYDSASIDNETVKLKMHQYEEDMAELTRQHLAVYRERLEDSKKQLDMKISALELRRSSIETRSTNHFATFDFAPRLIHNNKRLNSFLSTSADNLTLTPIQDTIADHPHLLNISFLTSTPLKLTNHQTHFSNHQENQNQNHEPIRTIYHTTTNQMPISTNNNQYDYSTRLNNGNLSTMEGLSKSQQAILDETDKLVKDSQQLHTESASQFERARESLLSSETSIRLARANMAASRLSPYMEKKNYVPNNVTLAELFKYEQSLTKEAAKNCRRTYSNSKTTTES